MLRKTLFWFHLTTGALAGIVVLVMAATGVLLTYEKQLQSWMDLRGADGSPPFANAQPLAAADLVARAQTARQGAPTALRWRAEPDAPVEIMFGPGGSVFLNQYTGRVLGSGSKPTREFFGAVTALHRSLALPADAKKLGTAITGAANLGLLFLVLSGTVLWWPRNWKARAFRNVLMFRRHLPSKARDFNWHNVIGFWSFVPLAIIVSSGVVISYSWAGALVDRIVAQSGAGRGSSGIRTQAREKIDIANVDVLVERAKQRDRQWRTLMMQLQPAVGGGVVFTIDRSTGGQPQKRSQLVLASGGDVVAWEPFSAQSPRRQARSILRFAHTGEIGGVAGQTIAGIVSAGALVLVYTGSALALRRLFAWRRRQSAAQVISSVRDTQNSWTNR